MNQLCAQIGKPSSKVTFVGVHDRRKEYIEFRKKVLLTEEFDAEYLPDAMVTWIDSFLSFFVDLDKLNLDCWFGFRLEPIFSNDQAAPQKMLLTSKVVKSGQK